MNRRETVERLDFDDHQSFDDEIRSVGAVDVHTVIDQWKRLLRCAVRRNATQSTGTPVGFLEETRADSDESGSRPR